MLICPICQRPGEGSTAACPSCNVSMVPTAGTDSQPVSQYAVPGASAGYPSGPPAPPVTSAPPPNQYGPVGAFPARGAPGPASAPPAAPSWDRAGTAAHHRGAPDTPTSPIVVVTAIVVGVLLVAAVGWFTLGSDDGGSIDASGGPITTLTPVAAPLGPAPGQTKPVGDGWVTYRTPDGAWLADLPVVPSAPLPLPSDRTIQMSYAPTDFGRIGFGWGSGQAAPGTDETALLVGIMKGIALSRGAAGIDPTAMSTDRGPVVTTTLQLDSGPALFVLRSVDRRPLVAMVIADLGEPDPAVAARMLDSFRPAG